MARGQKKMFWETARRNNMTYIQYYNRLTDIGTSVIGWDNLPDTIDERFLELTLFTFGAAVFFEDDVIGPLALPVLLEGPFDVYGYPVRRTAWSPYNNYRMPLNRENSVIVYNNQLHTNCQLDVELYALRLYEIERTIDVNVKGQKTPIMITSNENQRLTMENLYMKYDGNQPFIFGDKNIDLNGVNVLNTNVPFVANDLQILKRQIWNEALTYLGVENASSEKRERQITDEVISSLGAVEAARYCRMNPREQAADQVNAMFGWDIKPKIRENLINVSGGDEPDYEYYDGEEEITDE